MFAITLYVFMSVHSRLALCLVFSDFLLANASIFLTQFKIYIAILSIKQEFARKKQIVFVVVVLCCTQIVDCSWIWTLLPRSVYNYMKCICTRQIGTMAKLRRSTITRTENSNSFRSSPFSSYSCSGIRKIKISTEVAEMQTSLVRVFLQHVAPFIPSPASISSLIFPH